MKEYDVVVVGSGAGMNVAANAYEMGMTVAVVEHGPMGGTCLNRGCIPTKMLTYVADLIVETQHAEKLNVKFGVESIDFPGLMKRVRDEVGGDSKRQGESVDATPNFDWYKETGEFVGKYTLKVGDETIKGKHIFIVSGTRPIFPDIKGLDEIGYQTSATILELTTRPKSMIILGGGYIAAEFGHFFSAVGVDVTILGRNPYLVKNEDEDVSELLKQELSNRMAVLTNHEVIEVKDNGSTKTVIGRRPNDDLLKFEKTGVKTDERGFVIVDEFYRTSQKSIWALGDAIGKFQFRHTANEESGYAWYNFVQNLRNGKDADMLTMRYDAIPWAIFSYPPIATVGMTLRQAKESGKRLLVGQVDYTDTAKGMAMGDPPGFVRVIADGETGKILGATIIGPFAPILIQSIVNIMYTDDPTYNGGRRAIYVHPLENSCYQTIGVYPSFRRLAMIVPT
ncbi:MAG: dihydrolipoyl dehydrogenase family protein [Candidatus Thorarchaeota archaeon]